MVTLADDQLRKFILIRRTQMQLFMKALRLFPVIHRLPLHLNYDTV